MLLRTDLLTDVALGYQVCTGGALENITYAIVD